MDEQERPELMLPSRPKHSTMAADISQDLHDKGLHKNAAILLEALHLGISYLARRIIAIAAVPPHSVGPFKNYSSSVVRVANILSSMSPQLIETIILGRVHIAHAPYPLPELRIPSYPEHYLDLPGTKINQERPVIYILSHCSKNGIPPTKAECLIGLADMQTYIADYPTVGDSKWAISDELASKIDTLPGGQGGRDWTAGTRGKAEQKWKMLRGVKRVHPRRYSSTKVARHSIYEFIRASRKRLSSVTRDDEHLEWSIAYTGWTRQQGRRFKEHKEHSAGSAIAYLFESCMHNRFPDKGYFFRAVPIINIVEAADAAVGEQTISILSGSYNFEGGTNGKLAGDDGMLTRAMTGGKLNTWKNGMQALHRQKVFSANVKRIEQRFGYDRLHQKYRLELSEFVELDNEIVRGYHDAMYVMECAADIDESVSEIILEGNKFATCIVVCMDVWEEIEELKKVCMDLHV